MSKNDVEVEDSGKHHPHDCENKVQESENKAPNDFTEREGEKLLCTAPVLSGANKVQNSGEDIHESRNEVEDNIEVKEQTNPKSESNETRNEDKDKDNENIEVKEQPNPKSEPIGRSIQEKSNTIGENVKLTNPKTEGEEEPAPRNAVEEQMDIKDEVFEQNITSVGEKKENPSENCLDGGSHLKIAEEKSNEAFAEKEAKELVKDDADDAVNVARDNKTITGDNANNVDNVTGDNKTIAEGDVDYVENFAGDNKTNSDGDGDHVENVAGVNKTASGGNADRVENVAGDKTISEGCVDHVENVPVDNKTIFEGGADHVEDVNKTISEGNAVHVENVSGDNRTIKANDAGNDPSQNRQLPTEPSTNEAPQTQDVEMVEVPPDEVDRMKDSTYFDGVKTVKDDAKDQGGKTVLANHETDENARTVETAAKCDEDSSFANYQGPSTPNSLIRDSLGKAGDHSGGTDKGVFTPTAVSLLGENDDGTPEEQAAFMKEIESFYRQRAMDFKPPKFYGHPLNCLKLWRAVIRLGGYDRVTGSKLWRQVGESFHPPKTCTTVSWTFRIFYEKSLLEYERHKTQSGELQLPAAVFAEASGVDVEGNGCQGSGRARREAAARAMQGWHAQRHSDYGEVGEPIIKDKNLNNVGKREKNLKSISSLKQKRSSEVEHSNKAARTETSRQLVTSVVDVGPPADWVKINVRQTKDCFEIYALVPGLLREEVRVQTDPAGRVVITGQPEQVDNPWGITPFRKVVSLPSRIDPLQTSAVVSLHGRLFIRVPFEQPNV